MNNFICLDEHYSTTKLLTQEKPILGNKTDDKVEPILFLPENDKRHGEDGLRTKGYFKKSYEDKPLISIITVVFNGEKYLEQTIQSVIHQSYGNVEYIIVDGGSTDRTLEIIQKYGNQIDYWISEKDTGIYDAMNKGISLATGDYIAFLNADDWYKEKVLEKVAHEIVTDEIEFLYADIDYAFDDGSSLPWKGNTRTNGTRIPHPACFIKAQLIKEEDFNMKYKIAADYEMILRLFHKNVKTKYINLVVANFRLGGASSTFLTTTIEHFLISEKYLGLFEATKDIVVKIYSYVRKYFR